MSRGYIKFFDIRRGSVTEVTEAAEGFGVLR